MEMQWMTMPEVREEIEAGTPVIIPFGSTEQHGSHLPLATDTLQAYGVAVRAARKVRVVVAPPVHYGQCSSTRNHPGTVTISADTLRALAKDILRSLLGHGFTRFVLFSGHAGRIHMASLRESAEAVIRDNPAIRIALVSDLDLVRETSEDLVATPGDGHAGEVETSRMLHLHPDSVREARPAEEYPSLPRHRIVPDPERYWPGGVWGDPSRADEAKGRELIERSAEALAEIVRKMVEEG
ncbi:MAG: creatininase family protein [bacterium]|nr:MAG: creatininase family protein [bacterium]